MGHSSDDIRRADELLQFIRDMPEECRSVRGVHQCVKGRVFWKNIATIERHLEVLADEGVIDISTVQTGGRPTRAIKLLRPHVPGPVQPLLAHDATSKDRWHALVQSGHPIIYYIQPLIQGPIKIGTTMSLVSRMSDYITHSPYRMTLLAIEEGGPVAESAIHRSLSEYRISGEWFRESEEVAARVSQSGYPVCLPLEYVVKEAGYANRGDSQEGRMARS